MTDNLLLNVIATILTEQNKQYFIYLLRSNYVILTSNNVNTSSVPSVVRSLWRVRC